MLVLIPTVLAWSGSMSSANTKTCYIVQTDFTSEEITLIQQGVAAWNATPNGFLEGAAFDTILLPHPMSWAPTHQNNHCEIYKRSNAEFQTMFKKSGAAAYAPNGDIAINSDVTFCMDLPSQCPLDDGISIDIDFVGTVVHEYGHVLGLKHYINPLSVMNEVGGGAAAELGGQTNIHEDDYAALRWYKPHVSKGKNLTVGQFDHINPGVRAVWSYRQRVWDLSEERWVTQHGAPHPAVLVMQGSGSATSRVEWRLSQDADCSAGDYLVGERTPTMGASSPYIVGPYEWDLSGVPPNATAYYLCVSIDTDDDVSEVNENDNTVRSPNRHIKVEN